MSIKKMVFSDNLDEIFDELNDLTPLQRHTLKERFRFLMKEYRYRCLLYSLLFYMFRITMTVGSLAVPALLSIQSTPGTASFMYWITWSISLAVTTSNGIMTLFKLDKRFFMLHATAERLRSETWQYIQLSGRYSGHYGHPHRPTHSNQITHYCSQLEKINMKRVDDEYIKAGEETHLPVTTGTVQQANQSSTMVPSPPEPSLQTPGKGKEIPIDSISLLEEEADETGSTQTNNNSDKITLSVRPVSPSSDTRDTVLRPSPELQGESALRVGTGIQSGPVQQESRNPGRSQLLGLRNERGGPRTTDTMRRAPFL